MSIYEILVGTKKRIPSCYISLTNIITGALAIMPLRGLFKNYPTFGWEKYIYTPGSLQP